MRRFIRRLLGIELLRQSHDAIRCDIATIQHDLAEARHHSKKDHDRVILELARLQHDILELRRSVLSGNSGWGQNKRVCTEFRGLRIWVNLADEHIGRMVLSGTYEDRSVDLALSTLQPGGTFVDVGANIGVYTLQAARVVGASGHVFAFEPRPDTFAMLDRSVQENGFADRCRLLSAGLSDRSGPAYIRHWAGNDGASFVEQSGGGAHGEAIELTTLDDVDFGQRVDFFKIDVEGFETKVLRGGKRFFKRYMPPASSEVFPNILREVGESSAEEYLSLWKSYGYNIRMYEEGGAGRLIEPSELRNESDFPAIFNVMCFPR